MASLPPADAEARKEAALSECVRLLSSESREKKFVGMLLVTRLLPDASDDASLTRIYDAPGFSAFVTSMLRAAPTPASETDAVAAEELEARAAQASASHALRSPRAPPERMPRVATPVHGGVPPARRGGGAKGEVQAPPIHGRGGRVRG